MDVQRVTRRALLYGTPAAAGAAILAPESAAAAAAGNAGASPLDYGATGDGVTDDTAAVNRCLAANRSIDFGGPEHTYLITGTLLALQSSTQFLGGRGATIRAGAAVNLLRLRGTGQTVRGLRFDGNDQAAGTGIIVEPAATSSRVEGCVLVNVAGSGIAVTEGAHRAKIVGCSLENCGHGSGVASPYNTSIFVAGADFCSVLDNEVVGCDWGIYFRGPDAQRGINFYDCRGNTVTCVGSAPAASQGISNRYGRNGRLGDNTIVGFGDNSIDCFGCRDMAIVGNSTRGGKDGVFVGDDPSSGITITGNVFTGPQRGVRVLSGMAGALISGVVITGNTVTNPTDMGVLVERQGTAQVCGITIADNDLQILGAGRHGIKMINAEVSRIGGNRIFRPREHGILLDGVDIVETTGNTLQDAGHSTPNTYDGIRVQRSHRVIIRDTIAYGSARHAVSVDGGTGMTVTGTRWRSIGGTAGVDDRATNSVLADNLILQ